MRKKANNGRTKEMHFSVDSISMDIKNSFFFLFFFVKNSVELQRKFKSNRQMSECARIHRIPTFYDSMTLFQLPSYLIASFFFKFSLVYSFSFLFLSFYCFHFQVCICVCFHYISVLMVNIYLIFYFCFHFIKKSKSTILAFYMI